MSWEGADFLQSGFRQSLGYRYLCLCTLSQVEYWQLTCFSAVQEDTWEGPQQWQPEWKKYTGIWDIIDSQLLPGDQDAIEHYRQNPPLQDREHPDYPGPVLQFLPLIRVFKEIILQDAPLRLKLEPNAFFFDPKVGHRLWKDRLFRSFFVEVPHTHMPARSLH